MNSVLLLVVLLLATTAQGVPGGTTAEAEEVRRYFTMAMAAYKAHACPAATGCDDELQPLSNAGKDWLGMGASVVSGLDTAYLMGKKELFTAGVEYCRNGLNFTRYNGTVSVFETTIRILGGLLGAYELSREQVLITRAVELADLLLPAYTSAPTCVPASGINLRTGATTVTTDDHPTTALAQLGTVQLEMRYLSFVTGMKRFQRAGDAAMRCIANRSFPLDMHPLFYNTVSGEPTDNVQYSIDGAGDSFYEYLVKMFIQTGQTEEEWLRVFERALVTIQHNMSRTTTGPSAYRYVGVLEYPQGGFVTQLPSFVARWGHLSCFFGAVLVLYDQDIKQQGPGAFAQEIGRTCKAMYTELSPTTSGEMLMATDDHTTDFSWTNTHNWLRPEAIETLTYLWWSTGDVKYVDWARQMWNGYKRYLFVPDGGGGGAFSGLVNVFQPGAHDNAQQAFLFSETLKYFYLIFLPKPYANGHLRLDKFVFTTEAHPLRIFSDATPPMDAANTPRSYPDLFGGGGSGGSEGRGHQDYKRAFVAVTIVLALTAGAVAAFIARHRRVLWPAARGDEDEEGEEDKGGLLEQSKKGDGVPHSDVEVVEVEML